ncbi:hypothetical protein IEE92_05790 [Kocuria sp. cx-116]|uniref:hypothetical protein n=1 Tax=Kocuria sp. cx-116 TaxID=2771378 RepID=UPI0016857D9B|nr:hypothetical protein [Kocuria sp. cx-116]MBD2762068.1 hypothetical protein [Kocuria sp. cx-116]
MKFNFRRVKTPAYITSIALVVIGLLFALGSVPVAAWIFVILGIVLNVMAVSITEVNDTPRAPREFKRSSVDNGTRVVIEPDVDTEQQETVPAPSKAKSAASIKDEKPSKRMGSSPLRANLANKSGSRPANHRPQDSHQVK